MMIRSARVLFGIFAFVVFVYAIIFPFLTADALALFFEQSGALPKSNFLLLLFLEFSRLLTTLIGIGVAGYLLIRAHDQADGRALALFLLFATITYERVFGGALVPGPLQERLALGLMDAGTPPAMLRWLFGPQTWTAWPAIAALLRFSAVFPRELHAETLEASGRDDRQGFLRGSAVAGADIGAWFRTLSRWLLARHAFRPLALTVFAVIMIVAHVVFASRIHPLALWSLAIVAVFVAVTNVRGAYHAAGDEGRARTSWITLGLVLGLLMFLISTAGYVLIDNAVTRASAFGLMMLVPAVVTTCLAISVVASADLDARPAVRAAVRGGAIVIGMVLVFAVAFAVGDWVHERFGMPRALAALAAVLATAFAYAPVSRAADAARRRVLEHPERG